MEYIKIKDIKNTLDYKSKLENEDQLKQSSNANCIIVGQTIKIKIPEVH